MKLEKISRKNAQNLELHIADTVRYPSKFKSMQLYHCKAKIFQYENTVVLQSYDTIVAFADLSSGTGYDLLRVVYGYTATSAQHISKFFGMFGITDIVRYVFE